MDPGEWALCVAQTGRADGTLPRADNLHTRRPRVSVRGHSSTGFRAEVWDGDHGLLIQPHSGGYQVDLWGASPAAESAAYPQYGEVSRERLELSPVARTATAGAHATPDSNNRHERTPTAETHRAWDEPDECSPDEAGFQVVLGDGDHHIAVNPHPFGYRVTLSDTALSADAEVDSLVVRFDGKRGHQTATPQSAAKALRVADLEGRQTAESGLRLGGER